MLRGSPVDYPEGRFETVSELIGSLPGRPYEGSPWGKFDFRHRNFDFAKHGLGSRKSAGQPKVFRCKMVLFRFGPEEAAGV